MISCSPNSNRYAFWRSSHPSRIWSELLSPEEWIRIIGGKLPPEFRNADNDPTSPQHVNHIRMLDYGDLDSIVEMHGHIRALNPASDVEIRQPTDLDEANSHLVLIGNLSRHKWVNSRLEVDLRIRQPRDESDPNGESSRTSTTMAITIDAEPRSKAVRMETL